MDNQNNSTQNQPEAPTESVTPVMPEPVPDSAPATSAPAPPDTKPAAAPRRSGLLKFIVLLVVLAAAIGAAVYFGMATSKAKKDAEALQAQLAAMQQNTHDLPADAVKVSECIPNMGFHYLAKGADPVYGPFYLVSKAGRVIGIEYMFDYDMFTAIPEVRPPVEILLKDSPMNNWAFDHTEMSRAPEGHEGFLEDHIDVHNYTVTPEQRKLACV